MATKAKAPKASGTAKKRIRKIFGDIHEVVDMPNLIEVQRESYEQFLRSNKEIDYVSGLEKTLRSVFPIRDFAGTAELDFVHYELEEPKHDTTECKQRGITYAAPMKVTLRPHPVTRKRCPALMRELVDRFAADTRIRARDPR